MKFSSFIRRRWNGIVVFTPSMTNSLSARCIFAIASSRVCAIVISFATTALLLVVILAARGFAGADHVDGRRDDEA